MPFCCRRVALIGVQAIEDPVEDQGSVTEKVCRLEVDDLSLMSIRLWETLKMQHLLLSVAMLSNCGVMSEILFSIWARLSLSTSQTMTT